MKYIWDTEDVVANYGMIVHRGPNSEHFLIGYERGSGLRPCLVSMRDGMITATGLGVEDFAKHLNEQQLQPYRPKPEPLETTFIRNGRYGRP